MPRDKKTNKNPLNEDLPELTAKKQEFVRLLLEGKSASDAYRQAYNPDNCQPNSIWSRASELKRSHEVRMWLAAARHAYLDKAVYTHAQYVQDIENDIEEAKRAGNYGAAATLRGLLGKANAFLQDVSIRRDERTTLIDEIKRLEAVNPDMAKLMASQLGIAQQSPMDAIEVKPEKE